MPETPGTAAPVPPSSRRRWRWLLVLALLVTGAAATYSLWPRPPTVSATLRVSAARSWLLPAPAPTDRELARFRQEQLALARSRLVLGSALADPQVAGLPIVVARGAGALEWLADNVRVDFPEPDAEIMRISMRGGDTDELVVLVNAVAAAYLREAVDAKREKRMSTSRALSELIASYEVKLKVTRDQRRELEAPAGSREHALRQLRRDEALEDLRDCRRELRKLRLAKVAAEVAKDTKEMAVLTAQIQHLTAEVDRLTDHFVKLAEQRQGLDDLRADVSHIEKVLHQLRAESEKLSLELRAPNPVELLEPARARPAEGPRAWLAGLLGLAP